MKLVWAAILLAAAGTAWADDVTVDRATVTVEHRGGRDWCVIDAQASALVPATADVLVAVIQDYHSYPRLFPRIREVRATALPDAVLLSETLTVEALGVRNVNRFTLRLKPMATAWGFSLPWTQESTDGSIDSLWGGWSVENTGSGTRLTYWTHSAVPIVAFGQEMLLRVFLPGETKSVLEAVVKTALSQ